LTSAGRYREAITCFTKMATVPRWSLVRLTICHSELGEIQQAQDLLAMELPLFDRTVGY
jgi:hypothetical protein